MQLLTYPILFLLILVHLQPVSSNSQFCSTLHTTTKQDKCPNASSFDILKEYAKSISAWKLNIPTLNSSNIIEEIKKRSNQGDSCPYIRQTNRTICCAGWQGLACDQPSNASTQQSLAICHLWGRDQIRTFDGTYYQFPGSCTYKLTGAMTWQISIQFINCTNPTQTCHKKLTVVIAGKTLEIFGTRLTNLSSYPSSLTIRRQEKNLLDLYFSNGIRLKVDQYQKTILIQLDEHLLKDQSLSGLCGDYNEDPEDDLTLVATGLVTSVPVQFGNQWKLDRTCPDVPAVVNNCPITPAMSEECLFLTNQSQVFQRCFLKIDPTYFYNTCLNEVCLAGHQNKSSSKVRCGVFEAYAEECQKQSTRLQWRGKTGCAKRCSSKNSIYDECVANHRRTCANPSPTVSSMSQECTPGCVCSNDTVYDSLQDECVPLKQCSCQYNQLRYQPGDQVAIDCNDCKCDQGRWSCTNRTCPRTCSLLGNMNMLTFDGKRYALTSQSEQTLVESSDHSNYLRITYKNGVNQLAVQILNTKIVFSQNDILINGNIRHTLPYQTDDLLVRRASTIFVEVRNIQSTVIVHYDALTSRVYVKLQPVFVNRVRGLCGTYNYKMNDDYLTPNNVVETSLTTFVSAYRTTSSSESEPEPQIDTCSDSPANEQNARIECTNLLKDSVFSTCSPMNVDPTFYISACIRDLCADQSSAYRDQVKCSTLTALAHACALKGIVIDWMSNATLSQICQTISYGQCGIGSRATYSECVSECQSSCTDIDRIPSSCANQCLPGCTCPSGQFYDENSRVCRTRSECSCYEPQTEQYIHPAHSLLIQSPSVSNCSCSDGSLQCTSMEPNQCSSTQIYSSNTTLCPRTCANYLSHYDCGLYGPGCACPSGTILLDSTSTTQRCLPIDQCPCQYNRQFYLENETITQNDHGCQNCTCQKGGTWACKTALCTKTCTAFGHAHYQTFDGLYYNFPGQCQYILATDTENSFQILSENIPCGANGDICAKNILIDSNGVHLDLLRDRPILLNGIELSNYQNEPLTLGSIHIYQLGIYTIIKTDDFLLKWDGQTYVGITVQSTKSMSGLCGNNNDNFDDDLHSANGAEQTSIADMAQSWQISAQCISSSNQSVTDDPCGDSPEHAQRRTWARNKCDLIKIKSSVFNNPFGICIDTMQSSLIDKYYQACLYDACHADHGGDCESVCTVLSAFALECQSTVKTAVIQWRSQDRCPQQCDSDKIYMARGPLCPQSCFANNDYGGCIVDSGCVDGCFCPDGQVMDDHGQCVEPNRCPCTYNDQIYPQSSRIMKMKNQTCFQECECENGTFVCAKNATTSCLSNNCTSNQFTCQSDGRCIPMNWKCDLVKDCEDGSDELQHDCQNRCLNKTNTFQCFNGQCLNMTYRCDGLPDCRDSSDEMNCSYVVPCKEYLCPISKLCIPKAWICDGKVDCGYGDNSDEGGNCRLNQCDISSGRYFQCQDKSDCLSIEQRCDEHKDCNDGSDELGCSSCTCTSSFTCLRTCQCIDSRRVCDGKPDCIDGTDEYNCTANCAMDEYICSNGKCLNRTLLCDGIRHCSKGEDETHPDCISLSTSTTGTSIYSTSTPVPIVTDTSTLREMGATRSPTTTATSSPKKVAATSSPTTTSPSCEMQSATVNDRFISKPEFSTPITGSISDLNAGNKGISFMVDTPSTAVIITLPLKANVVITELVKLQILRPSNVNRFRLTLLDKRRKPIGHYQILSTASKQSSISPTIDQFPVSTALIKTIRAVKIEIVDTDDDRPPTDVTLLFQACFKSRKPSIKKNCTQIDAMNSKYTARVIAKLGGTRPLNSSYGNLLQGYGGVTYNTSQAVIDILIHSYVFSRLDEISIPDYTLKRTNVRKIIVELFDQYHVRLFSEKSTAMVVKMNGTKRGHIRFIRVSILETADKYAPFNVTLSVKGCFYRKHPTKKHTTTTKTTTTTMRTPTKSTCYRADALNPQFAHKVIGQFEGTQPLPGLSFINFIEPSKTGVSYAIRSPVVIIRFQANVVGQLDEIAMVNRINNNIKQYQVDLFDFNNNLLLSKRSTDSESSIQLSTNTQLFVSSVQVTVLDTIDGRPARGIILSIMGCFSTFPRLPSSPSTTSTTTVAPTTTKPTPMRPRECSRIELMNRSDVIVGVTSHSQVTHGNLGDIGRDKDSGVTFADLRPSLDIVIRSDILLYLSSISITSTNLNRFRVELLNNEHTAQYKIETSSTTINLDSLPAVVLAGIRVIFLQTSDDRPPRNIRLSIQACVEAILIPTTSTTTAPAMTTRRIYPETTPITPDHCADIDAMQEPYSKKTLAGVSGTNPAGTNTSLLDLIHGQSLSFSETEDEVVLFIIFKANLFVYLKYVGLAPLSKSNVKRLRIDYADRNQLLIRSITVDYSNKQTNMVPTEGVGSIRITVEETFDKKSAKNVQLSIRGCFGIPSHPSTTTKRPKIGTTTPTPCPHLNLMSNKPVSSKVIAYIAGTNPKSSPISDYFNSSTPISYTTTLPTFIIVFKSNIYAELKSISITNKESNVRKYKIDLIDEDRTILQTIVIDRQEKQSAVTFEVPVAALQITYLETADGQTPRDIILNIEGCFAVNPFPPTKVTTAMTTTRAPKIITTPHCHEIDMMNKLDSTILVDSITGTSPSKATNKLSDYFNQTSSISYDIQQLPITFVIILKSTVYAEIQSISLLNLNTNIKRYQVDLIDDYKSIVQTVESDANLTVVGLTEVGIAAIQITYIETTDHQPPRNVCLSIKGCFGILPKHRRTTPATLSTTTTAPPTTKIPKRKCTVLDAMSLENRQTLLQSISGNESVGLFSPNGLSINSTHTSFDIAFKRGIISNIENISLTAGAHNIKNYRVTYFDINDGIIDEHLLKSDGNGPLSVDNVATIRVSFLQTTDNRNINGVKLSIRGCFFRIPNYKPRKPSTSKPAKPPGYCKSIELMDKRYAKRLLDRVGGTLSVPSIFNATEKNNQLAYFVLQFKTKIFIRNIQKISLGTENHLVQQIRIELENKNRELIKRIDLSLLKPSSEPNIYSPVYPIQVKYMKITILKGKASGDLNWSITGCFDRIKRVKTIMKTLKYTWWTVACIHSNILAGRDGYHPRKSLTPYISGTPLPIGGSFQNLMTDSTGVSYSESRTPITIEIDFPAGIIGRIYEVGIKSSNVYRIRVQLVEVPNGLLYTLTTPQHEATHEKSINPRLTGFPPVHSSGIRITLLDTIDGRAPRRVKIFTNGCFYKSSVRYTHSPIISTLPTTTEPSKVKATSKPTCRYSEWTHWGHCSVSCGKGVQTRARNRLPGAECHGALVDYRMCQLQPCMCVMTKEFYTAATGQQVPKNNIVGYLKDGKRAVHIGDILDTNTVVYTHNCSQFICSNVGLDVKRSKNCQHKCVYLPWSSWSPCQGHCGSKTRKGIQSRQRLPLHILAGSHLCEPEKQNRSCQPAPCYGSCILSPWSKWTSCSKSCDLGVQKRSRYYLSVQPNCTDQLKQVRDCNPHCCQSSTKPTWSEWSPWGNCSGKCDGGERTRYRTCQNTTSKCPQQVTCDGSDKQIEPCNTEKCPGQVDCANGKVMNDCSNACGYTCNTLSCRSCNEPSKCLPGCVCAAPLVMNTRGECIDQSQCQCQTSDGKTNLVSGQTFTDSSTAQNCLCSDGCLQCNHSTKLTSSACSLSDWTPFGVCSAKCNGTQTRYRSRSCGGSSPVMEYDSQVCSTNETSYSKGCSQCSCDSTTGEETCYSQCAITPDICSNLTTDPLFTYEYIPPSDGQCCGQCNRTNKTEPCSVQQLPLEQVTFGDCISVNPIAQQQCLGTCISGMKCRCCSPASVTLESIAMQCQRIENNTAVTTIEKVSYAKIDSCSCQECNENV